MVIAERPVARVCPRCSLQIPGWPIYQDGMVSCLHCGFVLRDDGYRHTDFSGLLKRYENARDKITHDEGVRLKPGILLYNLKLNVSRLLPIGRPVLLKKN